MPIIYGVGDEVLYGALLATPVLFACRSFVGNFSVNTVRGSVTLVRRVIGCVFSRFRRHRNRYQENGNSISNSDYGSRTNTDLTLNAASSTSNNSTVLTAPENGSESDSLMDDLCCICHDSFTLPCQANCGHWFCGNCIISVWEYSSELAMCRCPICRRTITLLLPCESFVYPCGDAQLDQIFQKIQNYNRLFSGLPRSLYQRLRDVPFFLRRFFREFRNPERALRLLHNMRIFLCIFVGVLYVILPLDVIPESIVGILGYLDDILIIACLGFYVSVLYRATLISNNFGVH